MVDANWLHGILADVQANWILYVSMPLVAAAIGYGTKIAAIYMMFQPLKFVGIRAPYLGWQGIIPRNAARMAAIACDTLTARLLKPEELFDRLDPIRVAIAIDQPLRAAVEEIVHEVFEHYSPGLWTAAPAAMKRTMIRRVQDKSPQLIEDIMSKIRSDLSAVFDLKDMVVSNLVKDKELLNQMFREVGRGEFRFIRNSGIYFGFVIGCVQALAWALTHSMWIMPLFGGLTGWLSDWLALKMVFRPKEPTRYLGLFTWQGLFIKRRQEVASEYGRLMAQRVLTPSAIMASVLSGPLSDRLYTMIQNEVRAAIDEQAGFARPLVVLSVGGDKYLEMKRVVAGKVVERLPEAMRHVEAYAFEALDIENTLKTKMAQLTVDEYEGLLRPAFQQDEWILIAVGAALGFLVGEMQVHVMLAFAVNPQ
ncbi:DUF445 domain-containing protein [Panacagrimonas sp.]|uniref:DUF445 domain-containing protein n=1 Tax=Panacagrimonas sp. TaxID=2480088 RepID=UPI003B525F35